MTMPNILHEFMTALDERGIKYTRGTWGDVLFQREDGTKFSVRKTLDGEDLLVVAERVSLDDAISEIFPTESQSIAAAREAYFEEKRHRHETLVWIACTARKAGLTVEDISNSLGVPESTVLSLLSESD